MPINYNEKYKIYHVDKVRNRPAIGRPIDSFGNIRNNKYDIETQKALKEAG